jgi:quercetin dioxygenase-like cupin family protein
MSRRSTFALICIVTAAFVTARPLAQAPHKPKKDENVHIADIHKLPATMDANLKLSVARLDKDIKQLEVFVGKLAAGQKTPEYRFLYEQMIYVIEGAGHTLLWRDASSQPVQIAWQAGDLISPPLNYKHQHVNTSSGEVSLFVVTTRPLAVNMLGAEVLTRVDYTDSKLWDEYYGVKEPTNTPVLTEAYQEVKAGFIIKDIKNRQLPFTREGHYGIALLPKMIGASMAGNRMFEAQIFDYFPPAEATVNRHPWEVVYYVLKGNGAGVFHYDGGPESLIRFDEGDFFFEPSMKWHNHGSIDGSKYRIIQIKASGHFRGAIDVDVEHPENSEKLVDSVKRIESGRRR